MVGGAMLIGPPEPEAYHEDADGLRKVTVLGIVSGLCTRARISIIPPACDGG
jgi:hypothetical protein